MFRDEIVDGDRENSRKYPTKGWSSPPPNVALPARKENGRRNGLNPAKQQPSYSNARYGHDGRSYNYKNRGPSRNSSIAVEPRKARYKERLERESRQLAAVGSHVPVGFIPSLSFNLTGAGAHRCLNLHKCCSKCVPSGKLKFINNDQVRAPLTDILLLPRYSIRGHLGSLCPYLIWAITKPLVKPLIDPKQSTMVSPRVANAIEESALAAATEENIDLDEAKKIQKKKADQILSKMSGSVYGWLLKFSSYTLHWVFSRLFRQLLVQSGHVEMLLEAQKEDVPIIFLPSHKSHLDYILMSFVLVNIGIKAPHIAAGDNLNIPVFNWLIHHLGGWFIRRKLDNKRLHGNKDRLYRSCLHEYMEQLLKANQNIEFYIEGSRSRTGKPTLPKGGLLSVLVEAIREGVVSDILLVPTSVTYDRILERNFMRHELLGGSKKPENFLKGMKGVWSMITKNIGCVRMDFAQPFSLKEYIFTHQISKSTLMDFSIQSTPSSPSTDPDRRLVNALGYHIVYDFNSCAPVMATNIVGFMLMTVFRTGGFLPDLVNQYRWVMTQISSWDRCLGHPGPPEEAVLYALSYMTHLITINESQTTNGVSTFLVTPRLELPDVFELFHHANQVSHGFVKDSIIACSIFVLLEDLPSAEECYGGNIPSIDADSMPPPPLKYLQVSQAKLLDQALMIAKIFAREFIYSPPCVDIMISLFEGIENLKRSELLAEVESTKVDHFSGRRLYNKGSSWEDGFKEDSFDDDDYQDDLMLEVSRSSESVQHLLLLRKVLGPYIEGYWNCAMYLLMLLDDKQLTFDEFSFLKWLQDAVTTSALSNSTYYVECCSSDILRNAFQTFVGMGLVGFDEDGSILIENEQKLKEIHEILSICKI